VERFLFLQSIPKEELLAKGVS